MAGGWSKDGAVQDQIDASIKDAITQAKERIPKGKSLTHCESCEVEIPQARRQAIPGVRFCVQCQSKRDNEEKALNLFNRRGSKDSQLR